MWIISHAFLNSLLGGFPTERPLGILRSSNVSQTDPDFQPGFEMVDQLNDMVEWMLSDMEHTCPCAKQAYPEAKLNFRTWDLQFQRLLWICVPQMNCFPKYPMNVICTRIVCPFIPMDDAKQSTLYTHVYACVHGLGCRYITYLLRRINIP